MAEKAAKKPAAKSGSSAAKKNTGKASAAKSSGRAAHAAPPQKPIRREVGAAVCFFLGLFSFIGYFKVDALFIDIFCRFIKGLVGYGYYIFPPALLACAVILAFHRGRPVCLRTVCTLLLPVVVGALAHVLFYRETAAEGALVRALYRDGREMLSGGVLSGLLGTGFKSLFSVYGAVPLLLFILAGLIMISFRLSPVRIAEKAKSRPRLEYEPLPEEYGDELLPEPEPAAPVRSPKNAAPPAIQPRTPRRAIDIPFDVDGAERQAEYEEKKVGFYNTNPRVRTPDQVLAERAGLSEPEPEPAPTPARAAKPAVTPENIVPLSCNEAAAIAGVEPVEIKTEEVISREIAKPASRKKGIAPEDIVSETESITKAIEESERSAQGEYRYPPIDLLHRGSGAAADGREEMAINRERLQTTLDSFNVSAAISDITRGPTVTRYDLELEAGVKLAKLTNLAGDLALSLGVSSVRIAPIPDKISTVGVEVPNKIVSTVYLRDIIGSPNFRDAASKLTFAIGEDIGGNSVCGNIAKLPHMLIAGTTGSGKSVCMNSLILSLLYKAGPDEVKLIMIDPKMVELGIYNGIPHLYIPVVTDPKKAAGSLQWAVVEMLKRYRLFSELGVRDLAGYNNIQKKNGEPALPQVVIVIDELADLMLVASKEVEESICRVAQMGRASGMHLVIATQRPSADVITGLMKANIPSRIAFAVSSALESRIILDTQGAEKLVGSGDMLYAPIGAGKPQRIQGAFVTDEEREQVVNFIKSNSEAQYSDEIMEQIERAALEKPSGSAKAESVSPAEEKSEYDELLPQAVDVIFETKQASVSLLQRRLKLGYARAARIVDQMEELGVVGPSEGSKPRQIMITREQWQEMQLINGTAPLESLPDLPPADDFEQDDPEDWSD
ncbi:MAG: DNA translocase FtsK [Butyricicoccus sp.]|nr:DNA translocase FtsK [Butyricicoccus sp.]